MVMENDKFNQWFMHDQIHEVISTRASLLAENIHDAMTGTDTLETVHSRITTMLREAYLLGEKEGSTND